MSRPARRLGCGGVAWAAVVGAVAGYVAAVVDILADPERQAGWTTGLVLGGAVVLPLLLSGLVRGGLAARGISWQDVYLVLDTGPLLLYLGVVYVALWRGAPEADAEVTVGFALVGIYGWPMFAGALRVAFRRPVLRPPWWAVAWLFLGVPVTALVLSLRSNQTLVWIIAAACGVAVLAPVALWRYYRTRQLLTAATAAVGPAATAEPEVAMQAAAYAGWLRRAAAFLIDGAVFLVPYGVPAGIGRALGGPAQVVLSIIGVGLGGGLGLVYNRWYLAGRTGQTWGRRALGFRLVSERTGQPIGTGRAFVRDLAHLITDVALYYLGWLVPLWDAKRQTLADKLVHTVTVKVAQPGPDLGRGKKWSLRR
jgi:hypothetical protein